MRKFIFILFVLLVTSPLTLASKLYFNNGKSLDAEIIEANTTHVLLKRSSDLQQFRIKTEPLTIYDQKDYKKQKN